MSCFRFYKVWSTALALDGGITALRRCFEVCANGERRVYDENRDAWVSAEHIHSSPQSAINKANEMKKEAIEQTKKELARLEALHFDDFTDSMV